MGFFNNKNQNETNFPGGEKHWVDVIKYEAVESQDDDKKLIWRHPAEDFNTNSTLLVMPGEQAIFVHGGTIEQVFTNGTYKLNTENYPFISRLRNAFSDGVSTFNCVVYYIREAHSEEIKWGTQTPIELYDDSYGKLLVRARGAFKLSIGDPTKILTKLIGNSVDFETQDGLKKYFRSELMMYITDNISKVLREKKNKEGGEYFEYANENTEIAKLVSGDIEAALADYGLKLRVFSIENISIEAEDPEAMKEMQQIKRNKRGMDIMQNAQVSQAWMAQKQMDVMNNISQNPNGGIAAAGMGMGMGIGAMGMMGGMMNGMTGMMQPQQPMQQQPVQQQPTQSAPAAGQSVEEKLQKLKSLLDMGLISQQDFDTKKQEILSSLF